MSKFKIKNETFCDECLDNKTSKTFEAETLPEVFFHLTDFLRGVGYIFDGQIGLVKVPSIEDELSDSNQLDFDFEVDNK